MIEDKELSPYQLDVRQRMMGSAKSEKLFPFLGINRTSHHVALLQFWFNMGVELMEAHSIFKFRQSKWMHSYLSSVMHKKAIARNEVARNCQKKKSQQPLREVPPG